MPVFLTKEEARLHYAGFCNDVLWPLFHYVVARDPDTADPHTAERPHAPG